MRTHRTTYLCDQCGKTSEDYMDGLPLRWVQVQRNTPCKPTTHFCSWTCVQRFFAGQLAQAQPTNPLLSTDGHS